MNLAPRQLVYAALAAIGLVAAEAW